MALGALFKGCVTCAKRGSKMTSQKQAESGGAVLQPKRAGHCGSSQLIAKDAGRFGAAFGFHVVICRCRGCHCYC